MRICVLTQRAFAEFLEDQDFSATLLALDIDSLPIVKGIENEQAIANQNTETRITLPRVVCECSRGRPKEQTNGNWTVTARVILETHSKGTTDDANGTLCSMLEAVLVTSTLAADISSALADYTALCLRFSDCGYEIDGKVWRNFWEFEIDCCASDIA